MTTSYAVGRGSRVQSWWQALRGRDARGAVVLTYHSVGDPAKDRTCQAVSPGTLEVQLRALQRRATIVPAAEIARRAAAAESLDGLAAVTFDDGYADTLEVALPIASRLRLPFTVFVTTEPLLGGGPFWWDILALVIFGPSAAHERGTLSLDGERLPIGSEDERRQTFDTLHRRLRSLPGGVRGVRADTMRALQAELASGAAPAGRPMTVSELRRLAAEPAVTIGAHSETHPSLAALPAAEQQRELTDSRRTLESLLQRPVALVAYPFGKPENVSSETREAARAAGYAAAFTTYPRTVGPAADLLTLPRFTAHEWSEVEFDRKLDALLPP